MYVDPSEKDRTIMHGLLIIGVIALIYVLLAPKNDPFKPAPQDCPDGRCPVNPINLVESLADVPPQLREPNYSPEGQGSCVHASTITLLRWQGQDELAEWWRANYHSGEYASRPHKETRGSSAPVRVQ